MIEIRKATIDDIEKLTELRIQFMCEVNNTDKYDNTLQKSIYDYLKENISNNNFVSWVAEDTGKIIGMSGICFYTLPPTLKNLSGKTAYIMNMYTLNDYRKQGIASKLFNKMLEEAREKECGVIYLHATDDGKPLYEKFGFKATGNEMIYRFE